MIERQTAEVFYSPARGRRYFCRYAAIRAEAYAIIRRKYPDEPFGRDTGYEGFDIRNDPKYEVMHRRMCRLVKKTFSCGA